MNPFKSGWYLIYTRPQQEKKVALQCLQDQIQCFLPTAKTVRQWHDRKKVVDAPLFPSYVFVYPKDRYEYLNLSDMDGACHFIKFDNKPVMVSQGLIDQIRLMAEEGENVCVSEQHFSPGQKLVIAEGALAGLSGEVVQYNGKRKILVRIQLLNRSILADLPSNWVAAERAVKIY